jgi:hypothetical protein
MMLYASAQAVPFHQLLGLAKRLTSDADLFLKREPTVDEVRIVSILYVAPSDIIKIKALARDIRYPNNGKPPPHGTFSSRPTGIHARGTNISEAICIFFRSNAKISRRHFNSILLSYPRRLKKVPTVPRDPPFDEAVGGDDSGDDYDYDESVCDTFDDHLTYGELTSV